MQDDPWAQFRVRPAQQQPAPQQPPPTNRRVIGGIPTTERRAEEDQRLEREKFARQQAVEEERLRLAREAEGRAAQQAQQGGVEQGKAASFLRRAINAEQNFRGLGDVQPRSLPGEILKGVAPNVSNIVSDASRQKADQAEREFIAAILRYDSGAAIPPEEFVSNGQIYFPRPGDTPEVLAQKAEARRVAIEGLLAASGPAGQSIPVPDFLMNAENGQEQADQGDDPAGAIPPQGDEPFRNFDPNDPSGGGIIPTVEQFRTGIAQGVGDIVQGVGDTVGMFTDPFGRLIADALGYDGSQMQSLGTVAREGAGLPDSPEGIGRDVRRFAAGGLAFGAGARGVAAVASPGNVQNALSVIGRTPIRDTVASGAAGAGANIGGDLGGTPGQIVGGLAGGIGGFAAANRAMAATAPRAASPLAQAAQRQRVDMLPADAGGPVARAVTTGTRASPLSVAPVANAAERQQGQFGDAVRRTAATQGEVVDTQAAGETVRQGAQTYSKESARTGSALYDRAANMARGVRAIRPTRTVQAVDEALARIKANPAASQSDIASLEAFKARIEGGVSIQGLRDARTTLSQGVYDGKLRSGADQAMWKGILSNVADDIDAGLRSVGRDNAANAFRRADKFWSERVEFIDQALQPIIGRDGTKGGEEVLQAIESMARGQRGGNARLSRVMSALSPEEAGNVRATLIDRLGRATPGAQDAQGQTFSAPTFLTNWNRMTPQAKAAIFPDKATRDNLNDLAVIAEGTKRSQSMANTSNTGVAVNAANIIGGAGIAAANVPAALVGAGGLYLTGKLMASPGFARLLARTAKMPPEAANRTFREQLGILATREPALQGDINALLQAVNDNGPRLAAEENGEQQ